MRPRLYRVMRPRLYPESFPYRARLHSESLNVGEVAAKPTRAAMNV